MTQHKNLYKADEVADVESWSLPDMQGNIANSEDSDHSRIQQSLTKKPQTAKQIEQIRQQAYEEGYAQGVEQGLQQTLQQKSALKEKIINIINKLQYPLNKIDEQIEKELLQLSVLIAKQVVRRELQQDPQQIAAVIRECLAILPSSNTKPKIRLHPDDFRCIQEIYPTTAKDEESGWQLVEDSSITPGGCMVDTRSSHIDATIEARINQISTKMLGGSRDDD